MAGGSNLLADATADPASGRLYLAWPPHPACALHDPASIFARPVSPMAPL